MFLKDNQEGITLAPLSRQQRYNFNMSTESLPDCHKNSTFSKNIKFCPTISNDGRMTSRLAELAKPKPVHPKFIPDKPSVYWLDYLLDPTPQKITDPEQLYGYYRKFSTPRLETLSKPRLSSISVPSQSSTRARSETGVPLSALKYVPTERIKQLAEPRPETTSLRATQSWNSGWANQLRSRSAGGGRSTTVRPVKARSRF